MRKLSIIISVTALLFSCGENVTDKETIIPTNTTESFYWSPADISGKHFEKAAMYLPISLDTVTKQLYAQFDLGSDATVLYENNLKSISNYDYLDFDSIKEATEKPLFIIKDIAVRIGKINLGKRNVLGFYNYGEPTIQKESNLVARNSIGTIGADIVQSKILIIDFINETISILDTAGADLEKQFSFVKCKIENNRIMVPITVNGHTQYFMYDSGSSLFPMMTSVTNWKGISDQKVNDTLKVTNFGSEVIMLGSNNLKEVKIGSNSLPNFRVYYAKDNYFDKIFEQLKCDGIIGNAFFFDKTICIDYKAKRFGISR